jgi:molybdopterin converting factor small subunit
MTVIMKIIVLFFASTREIVGLSRLELELDSSFITVCELQEILHTRFPGLHFEDNLIKIAINRVYCTSNAEIKDKIENHEKLLKYFQPHRRNSKVRRRN